jgi:hypothetical protein
LRGSSAGPRRIIAPERRRTRPAVESLEGRTLLAGSNSPTNPVPIHPETVGSPTPQQLGAAYQQILAIQADTLVQLSAAHRRLYAAYNQLAARANPAIARDQRILQQGADLTARAEQGLVVARGIEDQSASTDKIYIPQHLFTTLGALVQQAQTTSSNLVRSARRGTDAVLHKLNALGAQLVQSAAPRR